MLGTYVDFKLGNRAVVQVFEGTSGVDVKKVSAPNTHVHALTQENII